MFGDGGTIFWAAFFPSMNPFGIAPGVRISYLQRRKSRFNLKGRLTRESNYCPPLPKLLEKDSVRKPLSADSDAFQHSITSELIQDKRGHNLSRFLFVIRDDATNKVGICRP